MNHPSTRQRVGLALAGLLSVTTIPSILMPAREGQTGPPPTLSCCSPPSSA